MVRSQGRKLTWMFYKGETGIMVIYVNEGDSAKGGEVLFRREATKNGNARMPLLTTRFYGTIEFN